MHVEPHDLEHDFPRMRQVITTLRESNPDFASLVARYEDLNRRIVELELSDLPIGDLAFEDLKKERLRLKDAVYAMLSSHGAS
ncbi:MAG TPA: YdcH family protein [Polyangiaceae bacterium]|nr:YdcH family protein [Polyangiaceae bacterium]